MRRTAIIGGGISGLTAAYLLRDARDVVLFEASERVGGHANTVEVERNGKRRGLDTGFIVYNERTYPLFTKLLAKLGVSSVVTTVSFAMRDDVEGVEYGSHNWRTALSQPRNLLRPEMHRLFYDVARFKRAVRRWEGRSRATLGDFLDEEGFGRAFTEFVALPLTATVWSIDFARARHFPFATWWNFLSNHGLGDAFNPPPWRSFPDGSRAYVRVLAGALEGKIRLSAPVSRVERRDGAVVVRRDGADPDPFDEVILAVHADQAKRMLVATAEEADALGAITYNANEVVLHTDTSVLPKDRRAWSAWNYLRGPKANGPTVTYDLNVLQRFVDAETYGVSLNETRVVAPDRVLARMTYEHPYFTHGAFEAQAKLKQMNGFGNVWFAGGYMGMSFHEDGVRSANDIVKRLAPGAAL
ncbi:MAG: FAD-dependent oxidoreductase [Polyangiaceae bacterium]